MISARINRPRFGRSGTVMEDVESSMLEGISLAGISGGQTDDDGVENGSERRWTRRSSGRERRGGRRGGLINNVGNWTPFDLR